MRFLLSLYITFAVLLFAAGISNSLLPIAVAQAQTESDFWPGTRYRNETPQHVQVLGYAAGEQISSHAQIRRYFEALAAAHPDRIRLTAYATSWEGRELFYAVIGSQQNIARLEVIEAQIQQLADGNNTTQLPADLPGTVWLQYGVHGNEISSPEAAMLTAYHLLAAVDDEIVDSILGNTLVFIDPLQNPDGRDRFVQANRAGTGLEPATSRFAIEHDEPWPYGRTNHYLFDLNRDWLPLTQPETRGRVRALRRWFPLAVVDLHEMGSDTTYFFAPGAKPYNPHLTTTQRDSLNLFGQNNARWFDEYGFAYYTREVFDEFYPGYGASWPAYFGGIAMTYEQASPSGLRIRKSNGELLTYREATRHHFVSSIATAQVMSAQREKFWNDFLDYRRSAINEGQRGTVRSYVIPTQPDQGGADELARLLSEHGIDVYRQTTAFAACGNDYQAGSYIISLAQPAKRLIRTLLDKQVDMEPEFIAEQERRRAKGLSNQIYDVTAWSLPLLFNLSVDGCREAIRVTGLPQVPAEQSVGEYVANNNAIAHIIAGQDRNTTKALAAALRSGLRVRSGHLPWQIEQARYPSGSLVFVTRDNPDTLAGQLADIAAATTVKINSVATSWVNNGPSFGSNNSPVLVAPKIALGWGEPANIYAPGAVRYVIEQQFGYPVTPIRLQRLRHADLSAFDVLILPDTSNASGGYDDAIGTTGINVVNQWVESGGVLLTLAGATEWAAGESALASLQIENAANGSEEDPLPEASQQQPRPAGLTIADQTSYRRTLMPHERPPAGVPGVLVKAEVNRDHWLSAGVAESLNVLVRGNRVFQPLPFDKGATVSNFTGPEELLQSGYLWSENNLQLAYKPFVTVEPKGRGLVIAFTEDPTVRAYLNGLNTLFMNAVLRAPSYTQRLR